MRMIKKLKGMTLIETMIYIALYGVIFAAIVSFALTIAEMNKTAEQKNEIQRTIMFIDEHLSKSISKYKIVNDANSIFNNNNGVLNISNNTDTLIYSTNSNSLIVNRNNITNPLTNPNVKITKFFIQNVIGPDLTRSGIMIYIEISSAKDDLINTAFEGYYSLR